MLRFSLSNVYVSVVARLNPGKICIKPLSQDAAISAHIRRTGCWEEDTVNSVLLAMLQFPAATFLGNVECSLVVFVKLRRGSGKDRQGMAPKAKGLKA